MQSVIQLDGVSKHYGARVIFESASVTIYDGQTIGVIGPNGAGKSTLARLITREEEPDGGRVIHTRALRLSYLEQQDPFRPDETAIDFLIRYTDQEEWRCGEIAGRFRIGQERLETPVGKLSGGLQTRLKLAAMLLRDPNFLILDEPTNFLDLSTLILLEDFLRDFRGGHMIISHDREFLLRTCEQTMEVGGGGITFYPGNVEAYFEFKEQKIDLAVKNNQVIEAKARQLQTFIDKHRVRAGTASQAQAKIKQLERLNRGRIEITHAPRTVRMKIPSVEARSGPAVRCDGLSIGYPGRTVASDIHFDIERGDRIAILGDNGQGKTTLMRTLAGDLPALAGTCAWSSSLQLAYYAQHVYGALNPRDEVIEHIQRKTDRTVPTQMILDLAGSFLFSGDDVHKKVSVLSGGERARLCLMGLLLSRAPVLLLDEPTNHLDFETVEALAEALQTFEGTIFFISHDRTFVHELATGILDVKDGSVKRYPGTYQEYVEHLSLDLLGGAEAEAEVEAPAETPGPATRQPGSQDEAELRRIRKQVQEVESEMETAERERAAILESFEREPLKEVRERKGRLDELARVIEKAEAAWLDLQQQLERKGSA